jgi:hypothetical protein
MNNNNVNRPVSPVSDPGIGGDDGPIGIIPDDTISIASHRLDDDDGPVRPVVFERRGWFSRFIDNLWFNRRHLSNVKVEQKVIDDHFMMIVDDEPIGDEIESIYTDKLERKIFTIDGFNKFLVDGGKPIRGRAYTDRGRTLICAYCKMPKTNERGEIKKFKKRRKESYETKLLIMIREKFPFALTPFTSTNYASVHKYAIRVMTDHNLRICDRKRIMDYIVDRYFVPTEADLSAYAYRNSSSAHDIRALATTHRFVDSGFQRFVGIGLRPDIRVPLPTA